MGRGMLIARVATRADCADGQCQFSPQVLDGAVSGTSRMRGDLSTEVFTGLNKIETFWARLQQIRKLKHDGSGLVDAIQEAFRLVS